MKKVAIISAMIVAVIFLHHYNEHIIIKITRSYNKMNESYLSQDQTRQSLLIKNSSMSSRSRIQRLASENLDMVATNPNEVIHIIRNKKNQTFCLVDYFVPSAEAITTH